MCRKYFRFKKSYNNEFLQEKKYFSPKFKKEKMTHFEIK